MLILFNGKELPAQELVRFAIGFERVGNEAWPVLYRDGRKVAGEVLEVRVKSPALPPGPSAEDRRSP